MFHKLSYNVTVEQTEMKNKVYPNKKRLFTVYFTSIVRVLNWKQI